MKIIIDGQCLQTSSLQRGIGNYTLNLISALRSVSGITIRVLLSGIEKNNRLSDTLEQLKSIISDEEIIYFYPPCAMNFLQFGTNGYEDAEKLYEIAVMSEKADWLLVSSIFESISLENCIIPPINKLKEFIKVAVICHDFIPYEDKVQYLHSFERRVAYKICLEMSRNANLLVCNSKYTANKARAIYKNLDVTVIYGAGKTSRNTSDKDCKSVRDLSCALQYLFYYGGMDERKNIQTLISAYKRLPENLQNCHPLFICCGKSINTQEEIQRMARGSNIKILGYLSEGELQSYIKGARACIFPSKAEGLGLPVLEVYELGGVCLCSNAGALGEIYDFNAGQFDPEDVDRITSILKKVLVEDAFRQKILDYCREKARLFSWEGSAKKLINSMKSISASVNSYCFSFKDFGCYRRTSDERFRTSVAIRRQFKTVIYFDVTSFSRAEYYTGIQRVVDGLIRNYGVHYNRCDIVYVVGCMDGLFRQVKFEQDRWVNYGVVNPVQNDYYMAIDLVDGVLPTVEKTLLLWKAKGVRLVYCIHDIGFILYPENIPNKSKVKQLSNYLFFSAKNADIVVSPSKSVSDEVSQWCKLNKINNDKIRFEWFHLGVDFLPSVDFSQSIMKKNDGVFRFIMVSTIEPRKDYPMLLEAFEYVNAHCDSFELHIVGRRGWNADSVMAKLSDKDFCNNRLFWHSNCSDEELLLLYKQSDCFVFTPMYEGFGIPIVEAVNYGLPLLLRDIKVFREIAGNSAIYFKNSRELGKIMVSLIRDPSQLVSSDRIKTMTWEESAKMLWTVTIEKGFQDKNIFSNLLA